MEARGQPGRFSTGETAPGHALNLKLVGPTAGQDVSEYINIWCLIGHAKPRPSSLRRGLRCDTACHVVLVLINSAELAKSSTGVPGVSAGKSLSQPGQVRVLAKGKNVSS